MGVGGVKVSDTCRHVPLGHACDYTLYTTHLSISVLSRCSLVVRYAAEYASPRSTHLCSFGYCCSSLDWSAYEAWHGDSGSSVSSTNSSTSSSSGDGERARDGIRMGSIVLQLSSALHDGN